MNKIKAVLFDLDGVLVDTRKLHFDSLKVSLQSVGIDLDVDYHSNTLDGLPTYKKLEIIGAQYHLSKDQIDHVMQEKQRNTLALLKDAISPNSEHHKIFEWLKKENIKCAVCSNSKRSTLDYILDSLGIDGHLDLNLSNEDVKNPKPSPDIYIKAMELLKVESSNTLIIEDSPFGVESALASGAKLQRIHEPTELTLELIQGCIA